MYDTPYHYYHHHRWPDCRVGGTCHWADDAADAVAEPGSGGNSVQAASAPPPTAAAAATAERDDDISMAEQQGDGGGGAVNDRIDRVARAVEGLAAKVDDVARKVAAAAEEGKVEKDA